MLCKHANQLHMQSTTNVHKERENTNEHHVTFKLYSLKWLVHLKMNIILMSFQSGMNFLLQNTKEDILKNESQGGPLLFWTVTIIVWTKTVETSSKHL